MTRQELRVWLGGRFCGCGDPQSAYGALLDLLRLHEPDDATWDRRSKWLDERDGEAFLLLYWLDHEELTEHGGSVASAWLTEKGEAIRDALAAEEADDFEALNADHCTHGFDVDDESHDCMACESVAKP